MISEVMNNEMVSLESVTRAYRKCLRRKRNTYDALRFEMNAESECVRLWQELNSRQYRPSRSIVFISNYPVKREIFGAAFRDRVVDTIFAERVTPLLEQQYIDDNYSTRVGKGTLYGIRRVEQMIRNCSDNYTEDCWVMKLDMQSYFMSLPKEIVYKKFSDLILSHYCGYDRDWLLWLLGVIINDRPELHCVRNSSPEQWCGLPPNKSLFNSDGHHGLPIGKVTSQMSALVFMDDLDHSVENRYPSVRYGHYMDDIIMVSPYRLLLEWVREHEVDAWALRNEVRRHPKKMYLQHYSKGVLFTGGMIKPGRTYINKRTVAMCLDKIERYNLLAKSHPYYVYVHREEFLAVINSYLGMMRHFASRNIVHRICRSIDSKWYQVMYISLTRGRYKAVLRRQYRTKTIAITTLRKELSLYFNNDDSNDNRRDLQQTA